jgi:hypothetical protein
MKKHTFAKRIAKLKEQEDILAERVKILIRAEARGRIELQQVRDEICDAKTLLLTLAQNK